MNIQSSVVQYDREGPNIFIFYFLVTINDKGPILSH